MVVFFDVQELYYLPQYQPIQTVLSSKGIESVFVIYGVDNSSYSELASEFVGVEFVANEKEALALYLRKKPDWLVVGNNFDGLGQVHENTQTAMVGHGIGPKACYYTVSDSATSVRFVEGPYRAERLKSLYPDLTFVDTGYAKLDPAINGQLASLTPSNYGLDDKRKTILYAPTFYPSSIECFSKAFSEEFSEYNIILKPHYFSLTIEKYKKQKQMLEYWANAENVYLAGEAELNILPFMSVADVLISDASSTLFEFAALNKPVVWCDFYKLRWGYRGLLSFRFKERMDEDLYKYADIAVHAKNYAELKGVVDRQISNPHQFENQRNKYSMDLAGKVDGKVSERIVKYMCKQNKNTDGVSI